jgi:hypothetical protein
MTPMTLIATMLLSFAVLLAVIGAMSVGVIAGRKPIRGSCGGLNGRACELCSGKCSEESRE